MLKLIKTEVIKILQSTKRYFFLNILAFTSVILLVAISVAAYIEIRGYGRDVAKGYQDKYFYKIFYDGNMPDLFEKVYKGDNLLEVRAAYMELKNNKEFEYFYSAEQGFENPFGTLKHDEDMESIDSSANFVKGVYADENLCSTATVKISTGRAFEKEDFVQDIKSDKKIILPVILGDNYQKYYKVGDPINKVRMGFLEFEIDFYVIGFFDSGSYFYDNNNDRVELDSCITAPFFDLATNSPFYDDVESPIFLMANAQLKIMNARIVCDEKNQETVKQTVKEILQKHKFYEFSLWDESSLAKENYNEMLQSVRMNFILTAFVVVISLVMLILGVYNKINRDVKKYAVFVLSGFRVNSVFFLASLEIFITMLFANAISFYVFYKYYRPFILEAEVYLYVFVIQIILVFTARMIVLKKINKTDLSSVIRAKE